MSASDDYVPRAARSEIFYFIARGSTIFLTFVAIPVAGFMLSRIITQQDDVKHSMQEQKIEISVLSAIVKDKLDTLLSRQNDQELRLRSLEQHRP